jgi:hypothetical protein
MNQVLHVKRTFDNHHSLLLVQPSIAVKESHPTGIDARKSGKDLPAKQSPEILILEANVREQPTPDMILDGHV